MFLLFAAEGVSDGSVANSDSGVCELILHLLIDLLVNSFKGLQSLNSSTTSASTVTTDSATS